ncbi:223_t:CDS:2, partial [Gigaspora margarita]
MSIPKVIINNKRLQTIPNFHNLGMKAKNTLKRFEYTVREKLATKQNKIQILEGKGAFPAKNTLERFEYPVREKLATKQKQNSNPQGQRGLP